MRLSTYQFGAAAIAFLLLGWPAALFLVLTALSTRLYEDRAEAECRTAYEQGASESTVIERDTYMQGAAMAVKLMTQFDLWLHTPKNEDPDNPRKLLVGRWDKNPFDPTKEIFVEVGVLNAHGFRPARRETREPLRS